MLRYYTELARDSGYSVAKGLALPLVRHEAVRSGSHTTIYAPQTYSPWRRTGIVKTGEVDNANGHALVIRR